MTQKCEGSLATLPPGYTSLFLSTYSLQGQVLDLSGGMGCFALGTVPGKLLVLPQAAHASKQQ